MKSFVSVLLGLAISASVNAQATQIPLENRVPEPSLREVFQKTEAAFVLMDCRSGEQIKFNQALSDQPQAPCSTFKIWNTLIGLEEGLIPGPDAPFYKWDGEVRTLPDWNKDLTLRGAFKASCVPAFQELARKIGQERMKSWITKLDYGNQDLSAGIDVFWLPRAGRTCIQISPAAQAERISRLLNGKLPVSAASLETLKEVMKIEVTPQGALYGKTGSGLRSAGPGSAKDFDMGWFVGFLEHQGARYAYACLLLGPNLSGKDARRMTEAIFKKNRML